MSDDSTKEVFHTDRPSVGADRFNRRPFARRIAQTIVNRTDPASLVLGIYGAWGEGKTTVLHFIQEEVGKTDNVGCIWFNPWRIEAEESLIRSFFEAIAAHLEKSLLTKKEAVAKSAADFLKIFRGASVGAGGASLAPVDALETFSLVAIDELKERLQNALKESGKRVVILVDDIDRLNKDEIHQILRLVKLSGDIDGLTYVLSFDPDMVAGALQEKYGSASGDAGRNFLEKIVQVPLTLPPANQAALRKLCFESIDAAVNLAGIQIEPLEGQRIATQFVRCVEPRLKNPRAVHRYRNAIAFALPLLKGEANTHDVLFVEAMKCFYPRLYDAVKRNADLFLLSGTQVEEPIKKRIREVFEEATKDLRSEEREAARRLVKSLFPRTTSAFENYWFGSSWDQSWAAEQRVASSAYFERYFTYAVDPTDIGDCWISNFLGRLKTLVHSDALDEAQTVIDEQNAERFVAKLRDRVDGIEAEVADKLIFVLCKLGNRISNRTGFGGDSPRGQAANVITLLMIRVASGSAREALARRITEDADSVGFACECLRSMRTRLRRDSEEAALSKQQQKRVGRALAKIIEIKAGGESILASADRWNRLPLYQWSAYGSKRALEAHLLQHLQSPQELKKFLEIYAGWAVTLGDGMPQRPSIDKYDYDNIASVVSPKIVAAAIEKVHGKVHPQQEDVVEAMPDELKLAHQFMSVHRARSRKAKFEKGKVANAQAQTPEIDMEASSNSLPPLEEEAADTSAG